MRTRTSSSAGIRTQSRVERTHRRRRSRDLGQICATHGVQEGELLRAAFGLLVATHRGTEEVRIAIGCAGVLCEVSVCVMSVRPDEPLVELATTWWVERPKSSGPNAAAFLDALAFPAFEFSSHRANPRQGLGLTALPFSLGCAVSGTTDWIEIEFWDRNASWSPLELEALADQYVSLLDSWLERPTATAAELIQRLPPLRFELVIASDFPVESLVPALAHWGEEIRVPLSVDGVRLGDLPIREPRGAIPAPPVSGAAVLLAQPEEWLNLRRECRDFCPVAPARRPVSLARLPNGAPVYEKNPNETTQMYDEIFGHQSYMQNGIRIVDGATIVDVGANIGLFSLFAHHQAERVRIHAVEPVVEVAADLESNLDLYGIDAVVHRLALDASAGTRALTHYPGSTQQSGFFADKKADSEVVETYARHQARGQWADSSAEDDADEASRRSLESLIETRLDAEQRTVETRTLSDLIDEQGLEQIDLLKIDVERAELDILRGIHSKHWPSIQQIALEVHDIEGRVEAVESLLGQKGFSVRVAADPLFEGTELFMVCARRPDYAVGQILAETAARGEALVAAATAWAEHSPHPVYAAVVSPTDEEAARDRNAVLCDRLRAIVGVRVMEMEPVKHGLASLLQPGGSRYSEPRAALATDIMRKATWEIRTEAKAIAVDADGVLWDGICGELGPRNVVFTESALDLHRYLQEQRGSGRLLMLCSKNNLADVEAVFAAHPESALQLTDFSAVRVNWSSKAENLLKMCEELSVAADSVVFVDDSPAERQEMAMLLPEVTVVGLTEDPRDFVDCLRSTWVLDVRDGTAEDALRASFIESDSERRVVADTAASFPAYLEALGLDVRISKATPSEADRLSQLSKRTNQFNLRLARRSPADMRHRVSTAISLSVHVEDRFGPYGLVGFLSASRRAGFLEVEDFLLSCRALGRNVEWAMLQALGRAAKEHRSGFVRLRALRGERNEPIHQFLASIVQHRGGKVAEGAVVVPAAELEAIDWRRVDPRPPEAAGASREPVAQGSSVRRYRWPAPARHERLAAELFRTRTGRPDLSVPYEPPGSVSESEVAKVWSAVLAIDDPGVHDDLVACGGDSLAAITICARLRRRLGVDVPLEKVLDNPTISGIAGQIDALGGFVEVAQGVAPPTSRPAQSLATHGQRRIWAAEQSLQHVNSQIIPLAYTIRGNLDVASLERALAAVTEAHDALRTVLIPSGDVLLREPSPSSFRLERCSVAAGAVDGPAAEVQEIGGRFFSERFDLSRDVMMRAMLMSESADRHVLLIAIHHSAADGWSTNLIEGQIGDAYLSTSLLPGSERLAYADYADWVAAKDDDDRVHAGLRELLARMPAADSMPGPDRRCTGSESVTPTFHRFDLDTGVRDRVQRLARRLGATQASVYLAAFQLVLAAQRRRDRSIVGCPVANRGEPGHDDIVGFLANIVPVASELDWSSTISDFLRQTGRRLFDALRCSDVPYGLLLAEWLGDPYRFDRTPFEALFTFQPISDRTLRLEGCSLTKIEPMKWPLPFELMLDVEDGPNGATALLRWDASIYDERSICSMIRSYPLVLRMVDLLEEHPLEVVRIAVERQMREAEAGALSEATRHRRARLDELKRGLLEP